MATNGIEFKNAISPASRTNPSMAGIFTGEDMYFNEQVSDPDISRSHLTQHGTLAETLSDMGYVTGAFNPNAYASSYYGFDRGFDYYQDFLFSSEEYQNIFDKHLSDSEVFETIRNLRNFIRREEVFRTWQSYIQDVEEWIRSQDQQSFLWLFSLDTHFPYLTPRKYRQFSNIFQQYYYNWKCNNLINKLDLKPSPKTIQNIIDIYNDSIMFADALLGELRGRLDDLNPVFVVHGDHGEAFFEHGMYGHFYPSLHEENIHVPTVVWGEDIENKTIRKPYSLNNIPQLIQKIGSRELESEDLGEEIVLNSEYDGRRGRRLVSARSEKNKCIIEIDDEGQNSIEYVSLVDDEELSDSDLVEEFVSLENACYQRIRHLDEICNMKATIEDLK